MYELPKRRQLTKKERSAIYDKCKGHCAYCGCEIPIGKMHIDHVKPISIDGEDVLENMLPACRSCNNYKASMSVEGMRRAVQRWPEVLMRDSVTYKNAVRYGLVLPNPKPIKFYFETMEEQNE